MRFLLVLLLVALPLRLPGAPVRLIFDTDIGNDIDDALAMAMIHAMETRHEVKLLAVTVSKDNRWAGPYVDLLDTFYGRPGVPIGTVRDGKTPDDGNYIRQVVESGKYPHKLDDGQHAPDAVSLLRSTLAAEKNRSVVIVQVGFSTNLARLLDSPPDKVSLQSGRDLVKSKVRAICIMAGAFPAGKREYNVYIDIPAARKLLADSPVPIVASGFEVGESILYPAAKIQNDSGPVADSYRLYKPMPYDRPTWDLTALLYAVRPKNSFSLSEPGRITVADDGRTSFAPESGGPHRYLIASPEQRTRALHTMVELASHPARP